jgi:hypothetical protein
MRKLLLAVTLALFAAITPGASAQVVVPSEGCNGVRELCNRPLDQVVLPTAHNAMSAASLGWTFPNQPVGIPRQLAHGVRGFLWDVHYGHESASGSVVTDAVETPQSKLYLCHQACQLGATPLIEVLKAIRIFLHFHPRNVIVIVNEDYVSPTDYAQEFTSSGLGKHVYRGSTDSWPRLRTLIRNRRQVVLLAEHDSGVVPWYHEAYSGVLQETRYDWPTPDLITSPDNWTASCAPNRGGTTGSLFLMNHWSPPFAPTPAGSASVNATDVLVGRARACEARRGKLPNLVAVDQFLSGGLFEAVRQLNAGVATRR